MLTWLQYGLPLFALLMQYLHYLPSNFDLSLYGGAGPLVSISGYRSGGWFVKHNLSIMAEHSAGIVYEKTIMKQPGSRYTNSIFQNSPARDRLGISLYVN
jgi:hypothetical protein